MWIVERREDHLQRLGFAGGVDIPKFPPCDAESRHGDEKDQERQDERQRDERILGCSQRGFRGSH
jgi:hypothetical protein